MELKTNIQKSVIKSQHCQRNWDLSKQINEDDLELMVHAITQCPSKQNGAFYDVKVIQNRELIVKLHEKTTGFRLNGELITNSQVLANTLFVFLAKPEVSNRIAEKNALDEQHSVEIIQRDSNIALGIASGYLNLTATMLGYSTGCCQCFSSDEIKELLGTEQDVLLMMGVGYKDSELNRRVHHADHDKVFYSIKKENIDVTYHK